MRPSPILLALLLAVATVAVAAPPAAADSCRSAVAEDVVCTPAYAAYCAIYAGKEVVACEKAVAEHCLAECPDDVGGDLAASDGSATCTPYTNLFGSKQRTCVDPSRAPECGAWSEGWSAWGYWQVCYGTGSVDVSDCVYDFCLA